MVVRKSSDDINISQLKKEVKKITAKKNNIEDGMVFLQVEKNEQALIDLFQQRPTPKQEIMEVLRDTNVLLRHAA